MSGIVYLCRVEQYSFIRALYVCIQVVTTIGYGDFAFRSRWGQEFMSVYILGCMVLASWALGQVMDKITHMQTGFFRDKMRSLEQTLSGETEKETKKMFGKLNDMIASSLMFAAFVLFGTLFYHRYEGCTCIRHGEPIAGCLDNACHETGGKILSLSSAYYMSIVTLTTVGFGDKHPETTLGQVVGVFWMVIGVAACGNFVRAVTAYFFHRAQEKSYVLNQRISEKMFRQMDLDHDGTISKGEFRRYMLLKFQLIDADILDTIDKQYDALDKKGNNKVSIDDITTVYNQHDQDHGHL